jgi:hypothetical protein
MKLRARKYSVLNRTVARGISRTVKEVYPNKKGTGKSTGKATSLISGIPGTPGINKGTTPPTNSSGCLIFLIVLIFVVCMIISGISSCKSRQDNSSAEINNDLMIQSNAPMPDSPGNPGSYGTDYGKY